MSLVLLAGYMNTYTSNPAPIDPTGGFAGNTVTPFDYGTCPCHAAVQRSRDLVSVQRAATLAQSDQTAVAVNRSSNIVVACAVRRLNASSRINILGCMASALAITTRWVSPPESVPG